MKTRTVQTGLTSDCTRVTVVQLIDIFVFVDQFLPHKVRKHTSIY